MRPYLDLLRHVLDHGERRTDRTGTGTISLFGAQTRYDLRDGFVHLSTAAQLPGTLDRYFGSETGLMLLAVDAETLGDDLRWETNAGGETYPNYYGALPMTAVTEATPVRSE